MWLAVSQGCFQAHRFVSACLFFSVSDSCEARAASAGWTRCPRLQNARRRGVVRQRSVLCLMHVASLEHISIMQAITASIFGVGAPEAVLVGVVALVVFGPRGLAQASHGALQLLECYEHTGQHMSRISLAETLELPSRSAQSVWTASQRTSCCLHSEHFRFPPQPLSPGCRPPRAWGLACEALPLL